MTAILKPSLRPWATNLNPRCSLRARFGLAIGATALFLSILASLVVGHAVSEQLKADVGQSLAELAYQMTDKLDRGMFERYRALKIISTLDAIRQPKSSLFEQRTLLEKLQDTYTNYAWIGLANEQGIVQVSTGKLLEGQSVSQRLWFINGQKAPYMGDGYSNMAEELLRFVDVAEPVKDLQGNFRGVLGAHLSWSWLNEVKNSVLTPTQSRDEEIFICQQNGELLLGPSGFIQLPKHALPVLFPTIANVRLAQPGLNGYKIATWWDGQTYLTGFARTQGYQGYSGLGWLVLVRQKTDVAFAPVRQLQQQIFWWNIMLGSLFAALGCLVAERIIKPITAIAAAADHIRQGNTMVKIPVLQGKDEIANLSKSLHKLVNTLTQQERELKASNQQLQFELTERQLVQEQIKASLQEKEVLLKEVHHRVKNNLQIISSLLSLQAEYIHDREDLEIFKVSQNRIESMALLHEKLYQSEDLARINSAEYIQDIVYGLVSSYEFISDLIDIKININNNLFLEIDAAIPCGLIINELVANSLKHAFPGSKSGEICVAFCLEKENNFTLTVSDNGIGFPQNLDFLNTDSLGLQLVNALTSQLSGTIEMNNGKGCEFKILFTV